MHETSLANHKILLIAAPKSGGTYLRNTLEKNLSLKYVRVTDGVFPKASIKLDKLEEFYLNHSISHTHANVDELNILALCKVVDKFIFHVRDPRNILVSWIHHFDNCNLPEHALSHICHLNFITQYFPYFGERYTSLSFDEKVELCSKLFYKDLLLWLEEWFIALGIDFSQPRKRIYNLHSLNYTKNHKYIGVEDFSLDVLLTTHEDLVSSGNDNFFGRILDFYSIQKSDWQGITIDKNMNVNFRSGNVNSYVRELSYEQQKQLTDLIPAEWFSFFNWKTM